MIPVEAGQKDDQSVTTTLWQEHVRLKKDLEVLQKDVARFAIELKQSASVSECLTGLAGFVSKLKV